MIFLSCICVLCLFSFIQLSFEPYISLILKNSSRCLKNEHKDHKNSYPSLDFERTLYVDETNLEENIEDSNLPLELLRLLSMEDKQIVPHQEALEMVNLGTKNENKEVKIGTSLKPLTKKEIVDLL